MKLTIDRFEGEYVVCENTNTQEIVNLDRFYFPAECKEGDLVDFVDGAITVLDNSTAKERIKEKMEKLWK